MIVAMLNFVMSCLFIFTLVSCGGNKTTQKNRESDAVPEGFIEGKNEVVKRDTDYYGVGYVVGKPIKISSSGFIFKTNEIEINVGAFGGDFIGNTVTFSIEDDNLAREFDQLDRNTLYVFKYEYPHRFNPEIESTHRHIRSWETLNSNVNFEHKGVESYREKKGGYSAGTRQGKVVNVERWGYWDIDCSIVILMGGIRKGSENSITMNTYSEEACAFTEKALKAGVYVSFEYSQDYIEFWD